MPYVLIETTEDGVGEYVGWTGPKDQPRLESSSRTNGHSIWRCYNRSCRAWAVTPRGTKIDGRCAKCGR